MAYLTQSYLTLKGLEQICCEGIFSFLISLFRLGNLERWYTRTKMCRESKITEFSWGENTTYNNLKGLSIKWNNIYHSNQCNPGQKRLIFKPVRVSEKSLYEAQAALFQFGGSYSAHCLSRYYFMLHFRRSPIHFACQWDFFALRQS